MLISNIINDSFDLLSRQLKFYCWPYKRDLDQRQQQELIDLLDQHYFERLADKIKFLLASNIADCRQQIGKLLFERCLSSDRRHQLVQLIESDLVDIDVRLDNYGRTLLHRAAYNLDVDLVRLLIDHGVNIRLRDYAGHTALHIAIQSYRNGAVIFNSEPAVIQNLTQIIQLLLEADKWIRKIESRASAELDFVRNVGTDESTQSKTNRTSEAKLDHNELDITKESHHLDISQSNTRTLKDNDLTYNRDVTICRMLGSHCMCNTNTNSKNIQATISVAKTESPEQAVQSESGTNGQALTDEITAPLVDAKNAFGRTALHYCVSVVGEQHLDRTVELLLSFGADPDITDNRLRTPLYCLVKRPGFSAVHQKCRAISNLINNGCDDLGLAISPGKYFTENLIKDLESRGSHELQRNTDDSVDPIFVHRTFKRVPPLKHLTRLKLIRMNDDLNGQLRRQMSFKLPDYSPNTLNIYVNRKVLDQSELF